MAIKLADYNKPTFDLPTVDLEFIVESQESVKVTNIMRYENNDLSKPLVLHGGKGILQSIKLDGVELDPSQYTLTERNEAEETLTLGNLPEAFTLEVTTHLNPKANESGEGMYTSGKHVTTQCEAEGFRKITFHPDRPDVLSVYTTKMVADKFAFPTILSNGNLVESGDMAGGKHFATWHNPHKMPSYLFAAVAGDLAEIKDTYTTLSGKDIDIRFYVEHGDEGKATHGVKSLKDSMLWDEKRWGRECDLDRYMVVSMSAFNAGAMENKGLNIFNDVYALANPQVATDSDFEGVHAVIGHEYFHNWRGNRVTVSSWFELTLKEGFTVFTDQEFTADHTDPVIKRISDVRGLRAGQFPEDSGPMSHPIRPQEVDTMDNFYTWTVYEKGAEVVRMLHTLLGEEGFRAGTDYYFDTFDEQAITTEEFVQSMEAASGRDFSQFRRWYDQNGTPTVNVSVSHDKVAQQYTITLSQNNPDRDGNARDPLHIPVVVGLYGDDGSDLLGESRTLELTEAEQSFTFDVGYEGAIIPSLLRNFSAPVNLEYDFSDEELAFLMSHDSDGFNKYEAAQRLATKELNRLIDAELQGETLEVSEAVLSAYGALFDAALDDKRATAETLVLPAVPTLAESRETINYRAIKDTRERMLKTIAERFETKITEIYDTLDDGAEYALDMGSIANRRLKSVTLGYLGSLEKQEHYDRAKKQFDSANNMTDSIGALSVIANSDSPYRNEALAAFREKWADEDLVLDKWRAMQARSDRKEILDELLELESDTAYDAKNPNRIRSLAGNFVHNHTCFHDESGMGYAYVADRIIEVDKFNPAVAANLAKGFKKYANMDPARQGLMKIELQRIADSSPSTNLNEVVTKTLGMVP